MRQRLFTFLFAFFAVNAMMNAETVQLSFSGVTTEGRYCLLDSVKIENLTQNCEWIYSNFCQKCENSANKGKRTAKYIEVITYRPLSQTYSDKKYFTCLTQILTEKLAICDFLSFSVDIQNNGCLCIKAEW